MDLSLRSENTQSAVLRGGRKTGDVIANNFGQS